MKAHEYADMTKREVAIIIAAALVIVSISLFAESMARSTTPGKYPNLMVSMSIGGGMNFSYAQVNIGGNGNVSYENGTAGSRPEQGSAKITPQQAEALAAAINWANLWVWSDGFKGSYVCTDTPKVDLSFMLNGHSRHVSYYDGGCGGDSPPQALLDLQHQIEAIGQLPASYMKP